MPTEECYQELDDVGVESQRVTLRCVVAKLCTMTFYEVLISQLIFRPILYFVLTALWFIQGAGVTDGIYYFCWAVCCHVFGSLWWSWLGSSAAPSVLRGGGVKHSNNHSPNIITYHLQYISPLYDGRSATVIL